MNGGACVSSEASQKGAAQQMVTGHVGGEDMWAPQSAGR